MNEHDEVANIVADKMEEFIRNKFTVNKLTDGEIVTALEQCASNGVWACRNCPFAKERNCKTQLVRRALDFINRQKAEKQAMLDYIRCLEEENEKQKAEIERLQKIIVGFMDEVGTWSNKYEVDISTIHKLPLLAKEDFNIRNKITAEAIKEFWEKVKQEFQGVKHILPTAYLIGDKIVKEMGVVAKNETAEEKIYAQDMCESCVNDECKSAYGKNEEEPTEQCGMYKKA